MDIFHSIEEVNVENPVITTGMFDGIHLGHLELINRLKSRAKLLNLPSLVVTFNPHPRLVLSPEIEVELLTTLEERISRFEEAGIDALLILPFTLELAALSSMQFLSDVLDKGLGMKGYVLGYDHRFGKDRQLGYEDYQAYCQKQGIFIERVEPKLSQSDLVSSSSIRQLLKQGDVENAKRLLGYAYPLSGSIVKGVQIGRTIGFPTANIQLDDSHKLIPAIGVYAVQLQVKGIKWLGMMNIGYRPTIKNNDGKPTIEVHIFNFFGDIYGEKIKVSIAHKLRDEIEFSSLEALKQQLGEDKLTAFSLLQNFV